MARSKITTKAKISLPEALMEGGSWLRLVQHMVQDVLEGEMSETLLANKSERSPGRMGYRSGYYGRTLITRVGKLELRVPQDRQGYFPTQVFERYQRSEKALVSALAEMSVQGVSTRKMKKITEDLCGHSFSASTISSINKKLDLTLKAFAERALEEPCPYWVLDARYERVREGGVIRKRAVLVAIGINRQGRRCVLGVELARRQNTTSCRQFLSRLRDRGLHGVELVVSDNHQGLNRAVIEILPEAAW